MWRSDIPSKVKVFGSFSPFLLLLLKVVIHITFSYTFPFLHISFGQPCPFCSYIDQMKRHLYKFQHNQSEKKNKSLNMKNEEM